MVTIAALLLGGRKSTSAPTSNPHSADFIGHRWRITVVQHGQNRFEVPPTLGAWVEFKSGGAFGADDGVNGYGGTFKRTRGGFRVNGDVVGSGVGVPGPGEGPPSTLVVIDAIREMIVHRPDVGAHMTSGQLHLSTPDYQVTGILAVA